MEIPTLKKLLLPLFVLLCFLLVVVFPILVVYVLFVVFLYSFASDVNIPYFNLEDKNKTKRMVSYYFLLFLYFWVYIFAEKVFTVPVAIYAIIFGFLNLIILRVWVDVGGLAEVCLKTDAEVRTFTADCVKLLSKRQKEKAKTIYRSTEYGLIYLAVLFATPILFSNPRESAEVIYGIISGRHLIASTVFIGLIGPIAWTMTKLERKIGRSWSLSTITIFLNRKKTR